MNPSQLATIDEAKAIALKLGPIGGGVKDIYVPSFLGPYSAPENGDAKFYCFRFANGAEGFNVGLIRMLIAVFPVSWQSMVGIEVSRQPFAWQ